MELKATWLGLSPPVEESSIIGKWYAGICKMKKYSKLFIGRLPTQFLDDENTRNLFRNKLQLIGVC